MAGAPASLLDHEMTLRLEPIHQGGGAKRCRDPACLGPQHSGAGLPGPRCPHASFILGFLSHSATSTLGCVGGQVAQ